MEEVLKPDDDMLASLATQMGLRTPERPAPDKTPAEPSSKKPASKKPPQKSYAQLT